MATTVATPGAAPPGVAALRRFKIPPAVAYILLRVLRGVGVLVVLSVLAFAMVRSLPGDPVENLAGPYSTAEQRALLAESLGLNQSVFTQYFLWVGRVFTGDWGTSLYTGLPATQLIAERLPNTVELAVLATVISIAWGVPAGALAARYQGRLVDGIVRTLTFLGMAVPVFAFGVMVVLLFTTFFRDWPTLAFVPFAQDPLRNLMTILLPALTLGLPMGSTLCRFTRASMIDIYEQDYIRTALAGGSSLMGATIRHGLRNASAPVATIAGLQLAGLIGNSILIENVFAIPGLGQLTVTAITQRDYAVAQATIILLGAVYIAMNLVIDLLYPILDPRIGGKR
ncbi:ABC transporter permease [Microbacterium sp. 18062]|uniref:ABC transporter permease n=1 Tax=Microbacterium sp. 18062 TaxID=2681410 RepID=UPI00135BC0A4|nr:ABC transporter permease [Microbacterium sp. 18062]